MYAFGILKSSIGVNFYVSGVLFTLLPPKREHLLIPCEMFLLILKTLRLNYVNLLFLIYI